MDGEWQDQNLYKEKTLIYDDPFTFAPDSLVNIVIINKAAQG